MQGALIIAALGLIVRALPFTDWLAHFSYDLPFALRSATPPDEVTIVYMDDESRIDLGQPVEGPWDRALHIDLLKQLRAQGARAVAFDVLFDQPWKVGGVDEEFAEAVRTHGRVVLGASCKYTGGSGEPIVGNLIHATEPLGSAAPWGVAELPVDTDGIIRRHFYDEFYTNLAWQAAVVAGLAPGNRSRERWINYYGPSGSIPHVSYRSVLNPESVPQNLISNKVVFVGMAPIINYQGSRSFDEFPTSYTRWTGQNFTGVEIHATACLNLLRNDWLTRLPKAAEFGLILLAGLVLGGVVSVMRPSMAFVVVISLALFVGIIGVLLSLLGHWWFDWAVISFVQSPAVAVLSIVVGAPERSRKNPVRSASGGPSGQSGGLVIPQIADHEILKPFGSGSYGEVWLARTVLGTYRAVKIVRRDAFEDASPFDREFRGIQAFEPVSRSHDGFVHILQVGRREEEGLFYSVMELADDRGTGQTIDPESYTPRTVGSDLSARGKIPCEECVEVGLQLTGALQVLHEAGLVHRDIKPSNIIFVKSHPKLADIGLVAATSEAKSFVGTQGFLPPEGPGQPQGDIYSLGKVLYEMAMGRDRCRFPELPTTLAEDPDADKILALNEILIKACENQAESRYASAAEMHADLKKLADQFSGNCWSAGNFT